MVTDTSTINMLLGNYKMERGPYPICVGIIPAAFPFMSEERIPNSGLFKHNILAAFVIIVAIALNLVILVKTNNIEKRFRERIGPMQVNQHNAMGGGKMHPALEHMIGVMFLFRAQGSYI